MRCWIFFHRDLKPELPEVHEILRFQRVARDLGVEHAALVAAAARFRDARGDQRARLVRCHFVHMDTSGVHRDIRPASGDQPSAGLLAYGKKRLEVRFLPNIIDNEEAVTIR